MENINEDYLYWLAFSAFQGIGPKRFALLKNYFGSAKTAWLVPAGELLSVNLPQNLVDKLVKFRSGFDPNSYYLRLRENNIDCYFTGDKKYPDNLLKIVNPPFVLYVKGVITTQDQVSIGIVGSRKMTAYGRTATETLVSQLAIAGMTIVSGLARGVDTTAHKTALEVKGRTIAVLGGGLNNVYPPENTILADQIAESGAVISEYPPDAPALPGNFPARNRIISGLSLGVVVIEGAADSGAMITANDAAEQGREVFAVPGPITSPNSAGPANLIKTGAKLVWQAEDILEELNIGLQAKKVAAREILPESNEEKLLLSLLQNESKHIDLLIRESGLDTGTVASVLATMEIKGMVKNIGGMNYQRVC